MWDFRSVPLPGGRGLHFTVTLQAQPALFSDVLRGWQSEAAFRSLFNAQLAAVPYTAFRWETPALTSANRPFEFVMLDSSELARTASPTAFAEHFSSAPEAGVVEFLNLAGDAVLIVPCPLGPSSAYGHLAAFVRQAPEPQRHALWQTVGAALARRSVGRPVWLSTAGAGVVWLHVRLDDRPKYYGFEPYQRSA